MRILIAILLGMILITVVVQSFAADYNYDVDGDGVQNALTDGVLIQRYLFGMRGGPLCNGIVEPQDCAVVQENIRVGNCSASKPPPEPEPSPPPTDPHSCLNYSSVDDGKTTGRCTGKNGEQVIIVNRAPGGWTIPPTCVNNRSDANSRCESDGSSIRPGEVWVVRIKHKAQNANDQTRPVSYTKSETPGEMPIKYEIAVSSVPGNFDVENRRCRSNSTVTTLDESSPYTGYCKIPVGTSYASFRPLNKADEQRCSTISGRRCRPKILGAAFYE